MRTLITFTGLILLACETASCSPPGFTRATVGSRSFEIPAENLVTEQISWLPKHQGPGVSFVIDPQLPLRKQHSVLLQRREEFCDGGARPIDESGSLCRNRINFLLSSDVDANEIRKVGDSAYWRYVMTGGRYQNSVVASCFLMADGNNAACNARGEYRELVYEVSFYDAELGDLPSIKRRIGELLSRWDRSTAS